MTLNQALVITNSRKGSPVTAVYFLACGFEPMHLATLFKAHLLERMPDGGNVEIRHGVYGDLAGNIVSAGRSLATAAGVILEWSDIDPRLGMRASGGWSNAVKADILSGCPERFSRLEAALADLGSRMTVALAAPSLPVPPVGNTIRAQSSVLELELEWQLAAFLARAARLPGVRVIARSSVEPTGASLDARKELIAGFPYTVPFADALARSLTEVLCQSPPKKGLITDLDGTLWAGIIGEVGTEGISWSQDHHTQSHGLYQQMLGHLADCGVLLAVCSKNEPATAADGLSRTDLFLDPQVFFPVHANWGPKSASVARILETWNIGADAVVFVDDSPMELAEVQQAFPRMTCTRFPGNDPAAVWTLLGDLRDLFGKPVLTEEDQLRQSSIRASAQIRDMAAETGPAGFLESLEGTITVSWETDAADKRPLELINKTNQFNLNGLRIAEGDWLRRLGQPGAITAVVSYQDKFGPLGKIAVLLGDRNGATIRVSHWVMSCRAFSRRIEHQTLDSLFRQTGLEEIEFAFEATERNQPLQEFFAALGILPGDARISRAGFEQRRGPLPHAVRELPGGAA